MFRSVRYFVSLTRHQGKWMPLYRKGEHTIKQPVFVGDVARAVEKAIQSPDAAGETYEALGPRRYQLSELVDWFHRVTRKKSDWGYVRYDLKWDPFLVLRARANELICPSWPIGTFVPDKVERVSYEKNRLQKAGSMRGGRPMFEAPGGYGCGWWQVVTSRSQ